MKRTRAIDIELLCRKGVREEIRREALADLAKLDKKPELAVLIDAIKALDDRAGDGQRRGRLRPRPAPHRSRRRRADRRSARAGRARDRWPQAGHAAARLSRPDRRRRRRRQGLGARLEVGRLAPRPGRRHARDPRSRPAVGALSQGPAAARRAAEGARRRHKGVKGDRGAIRPDRATGPPHADARRGRGLSATAGMSPRSARPPRRTRLTAAPPSERSTATRTASYGDGGQTHTQENTANPWWEVDLGAELPDRLDRRLEPDGGRLLHAAQPLHDQGPRRGPQRRLRGRQPAGPGGSRPRPRSAAPVSTEPSDARRWSR